ncbi:MAG: heme NO-binding domain-containing protein [Planctomycetota bacterium]|nr:heme NO-binding domain-containing protein [Planctomycetota bacterium]
MKGVVFTEFLDFADGRLGAAVVEGALVNCDLKSGGAYTAVGTYDHEELVAILSEICRQTGHSANALLRDFGEHLFATLARGYPVLLETSSDSFSLLEKVEGVIHVEVRKLYPDAQLPTFKHERLGPHELVLDYHSERAFGDLADGLLRGCFAHFKESVEMTREEAAGSGGTQIRFHLKRN